MSRHLSRLRALVLAGITLLAIVLGVVGLFAVGAGGWFGPASFDVLAGFEDVSGIDPGARVRARGIPVGEVIAIERGPDDKRPVLLRLRIKGEFRNDFREGASARIINEGLLGNKAVEIRLPNGSRDDRPLLAAGTILPSEPSGDPFTALSDFSQRLSGVGPVKGPGPGDLVLRAGFHDISGISPGTQVRIRGLHAGEVLTIERGPDDDRPVLMRFFIKDEFRRDLREGASVRIVSEGLLGTKSIEVRVPRPSPGLALADLPPVTHNALLPSDPTSDPFAALGPALQGLSENKGTVGKLLNDPEAYNALVALLQSSNDAVSRSKDTLDSIQRSSDAMKKVPLIGGYVDEGPTTLLVRAHSVRHDRIFAETDLFEPNRAVLTAKGKEALDELGDWLTGLRQPGSDVVVVSYASPSVDADTRQEITNQQSRAVVEYLKSKHAAHKLGGWGWFSGNRKVTALGMGTRKPPQPDKRSLPSARTEIIVFVPQE